MSAQHTPGPWACSRSATPDYAPQFSVYSETGAGHDLAIVKGDNAQADAALIEAAPDLLAALELAQERLEINNCEGEENDALATIANAIAKAKAVQS